MLCPKCGSLMRPLKRREKIMFRCSACGYEGEEGKNVDVIDRIGSMSEEIRVVRSEQAFSLPTVTKVCPKCGNSKAYFQMVQIRSADEPPTRIYMCTNCSYSWREFS